VKNAGTTQKPRRLLIVPSLQPVAGLSTSGGYPLIFPRSGRVVRAIFCAAADGTADAPTEKSLEARITLAGGEDLFSDGRSSSFANVGLLALSNNQSTGPTLVGGAGIDLFQRVAGAEVWNFFFKNLHATIAVNPRAALVWEPD
jgi:hypothetical protein